MDLARIIGDLRAERTALVEAIATLERLAGLRSNRGRQPAPAPAHLEPEPLRTLSAAAGTQESGPD